LSDQLGEDITSEDTCTARAKLDLARKLETALEELGTAELGLAWLFLKQRGLAFSQALRALLHTQQVSHAGRLSKLAA